MGRGAYFAATKKRKARLVPRISLAQQKRIKKMDMFKIMDAYFGKAVYADKTVS